MNNNSVTITTKHFSTEQTALLKGIGILLIVLHNFCHHLAPVIGENEFLFSYDSFWNFYTLLLSCPEKFPQAFFSYFGHYGVQIFVFFSAYGLTRKYHGRPLIIRAFLKDRGFKIYFSFLLCLAIYLLLAAIKATFLADEKVFYWDSLLWKLLLISNFIPGQALMPVGPWWFIPFIMQAYLLYPFLLKGYQKYGHKLLVGLSLLSIMGKLFINPHLLALQLNINHTVFGHLSVICLGIELAAQKSIKIPRRYSLLALLAFILGNFNPYLWMVSDLSITVLFVAVSIAALQTPLPNTLLTRILLFYGNISFPLFMVNGFLRSPFHNFAESHATWWINIVAALASLLFATVFAYCLKKSDEGLRTILTNHHTHR
jgi:peptidoglycan/LPS O-acetylase OafA/YrhL